MRSGVRIAAWLLACTVLSSAVPGCARKESSSAPAAASVSGDASLPATARQVLAWLPGDEPVAGWKRTKAPQVFGPDNLWEFNDGGAETYLTFGFQELVSVTCAESDLGVEATIEVYRMADSLNAFGIYAQERNPNATFIATGAEGYAAPNIVNFWNDAYYVKLTATKTNDRIAAALVGLANHVSQRIGPPSASPATSLAFPARDQVAHSVKYLPRNVLGQSYLANGFEAQYRIGSKACRLVTASFESTQEATDAFARYRSFVASSGQNVRKLPSADSGFAGSDSFNGSIVAIRSGSTLVFALGAPSERAGLDLISALLAAVGQGFSPGVSGGAGL
jgi:hypothetical protein